MSFANAATATVMWHGGKKVHRAHRAHMWRRMPPYHTGSHCLPRRVNDAHLRAPIALAPIAQHAVVEYELIRSDGACCRQAPQRLGGGISAGDCPEPSMCMAACDAKVKCAAFSWHPVWHNCGLCEYCSEAHEYGNYMTNAPTWKQYSSYAKIGTVSPPHRISSLCIHTTGRTIERDDRVHRSINASSYLGNGRMRARQATPQRARHAW